MILFPFPFASWTNLLGSGNVDAERRQGSWEVGPGNRLIPETVVANLDNLNTVRIVPSFDFQFFLLLRLFPFAGKSAKRKTLGFWKSQLKKKKKIHSNRLREEKRFVLSLLNDMSFNDILNISNNSRNIMKYLLGNDNGNQVVKMIDEVYLLKCKK